MGASFASGGDGGSAPHGLVGSFVSEPTAFFLHPEDFPSEEVYAGGLSTKAIAQEEKKVMGAVFEEEDPTFVEEEEEDDEEADAVLVPSDVSTASLASGEEEDEGASRERSVLWRGASLSLCESESLRAMRWRRETPAGRGCLIRKLFWMFAASGGGLVFF
jgi:hypothetical protein